MGQSGLALVRLGNASLLELGPKAPSTEQSFCLASCWPVLPRLLLVLYSNKLAVPLYFLENVVYIFFTSCSRGRFLFGVPALLLNFLITLNRVCLFFKVISSVKTCRIFWKESVLFFLQLFHPLFGSVGMPYP